MSSDFVRSNWDDRKLNKDTTIRRNSCHGLQLSTQSIVYWRGNVPQKHPLLHHIMTWHSSLWILNAHVSCRMSILISCSECWQFSFLTSVSTKRFSSTREILPGLDIPCVPGPHPALRYHILPLASVRLYAVQLSLCPPAPAQQLYSGLSQYASQLQVSVHSDNTSIWVLHLLLHKLFLQLTLIHLQHQHLCPVLG